MSRSRSGNRWTRRAFIARESQDRDSEDVQELVSPILKVTKSYPARMWNMLAWLMLPTSLYMGVCLSKDLDVPG